MTYSTVTQRQNITFELIVCSITVNNKKPTMGKGSKNGEKRLKWFIGG